MDTIDTSLTWAAAALSALWCGVHLFWGGRDVARPLREATTLSDEVRATAWLCWHLVTVSLALMSGLLGWAALSGDRTMVVAPTLLAALYAAMGLAVPLILKVPFRLVPQGALFVPVAVLGWLAL